MARLPDGVYRELFLERLAAEVGLHAERLGQLLQLASRDTAPATAPRAQSASGRRTGLVRHAIRLVLHYPSIAAEVDAPEDLRQIDQPGVPLLFELLEIARGRPDINTAVLEERLRDRPEAQHLQTLLAQEILVSRDEAAAELSGSLVGIRRLAQERRMEDLIARADQLSAQEKQEFLKLQQSLSVGGGAT